MTGWGNLPLRSGGFKGLKDFEQVRSASECAGAGELGATRVAVLPSRRTMGVGSKGACREESGMWHGSQVGGGEDEQQ